MVVEPSGLSHTENSVPRAAIVAAGVLTSSRCFAALPETEAAHALGDAGEQRAGIGIGRIDELVDDDARRRSQPQHAVVQQTHVQRALAAVSSSSRP